MLVITNKIFNENLSLERIPAAIPNDSIERTSFALTCVGLTFLNGGSLLNSLQSIEYCEDVLRWHHLKSLPPAGVVQKFYNPGTQRLIPFDQRSVFTPYSDINP